MQRAPELQNTVITAIQSEVGNNFCQLPKQPAAIPICQSNILLPKRNLLTKIYNNINPLESMQYCR